MTEATAWLPEPDEHNQPFFEGARAGELHRYPDGGSNELRDALARFYGLEAARIVVGNGSDELISFLTRAYAGPGDEVLYSRHGFLMYPIAAKSAGATPVQAAEVDYTASVDNLLAAVSPRTRIVFLANPNNPPGTYVSSDEVRRLRAGLAPDVLLVIDAAYAEYCSMNDYTAGAELVEAGGATVMTRTFSKIFGLAGLRLGWAYCPADVADVLNRIRPPFNVNAAAQAAGVAALDRVAHTHAARTQTDVERPRLAAALAGFGLEVLPSVANFVTARFATEGRHTSAAAHAFLKERGILPRAIAGYGLPEALRFTIGTEVENDAVIAALKDFFGDG